MILTTFRRCALLVAVVATLAATSSQLNQSLSFLRGLGNGAFQQVCKWARSGAPPVYTTFYDYQQAEAGINNLGSSERWAVLQWLRGNGRSQLHALGVPDSAIGPRRAGADYAAATPAPDPWRELKFATLTLGQSASPDKIEVKHGFGAAKRDGKEILACVSFTNQAAIAATRVVFEFDITDANGKSLGDMVLDRRGTFSSGIGIYSWSSYSDWRAGQQNRGYSDNCKSNRQSVAAMPVLDARFITYRVTRVEYADGSMWTASP